MPAPAEAAPMRDDVTEQEATIANKAVELCLNPDGSNKYDSAQGYACAVAAIRLAFAAARSSATSMDAKADNMEARPDAGDEDVERVAKSEIEDAMDNAGSFDPGEVVVPISVAYKLAAMREGVDRGMVERVRADLAIATAALRDIEEGPILRVEPGNIVFKDAKQAPILVARAALAALTPEQSR